MVCIQIILKLVFMKFILFLILFSLFACKRNHSSVLVKVLDNETGVPLSGSKVEVIRKGKKGWLIDKEHLLVETAYTNSSGEVLVNFKYDRGNKYALFVYAAGGYFQNSSYEYFDLEKGGNTETVYLYQASYLKIKFKSNNPSGKFLLNVSIEDITSEYVSGGLFYHYTNPIDSTIFKMISKGRGNKNIIWKLDSLGYEKNYSLPIELKGHDTTYITINF